MDNAYLINTETMQWPIYEGDFRAMYPDTCFPNPLANPPQPYSWVEYTPRPSYDWMTQGVREVTPVYADNTWLQQWEVYGLTPEEIAANEEQEKANNKTKAESLLQATDWTATVDINNPQYSNPYLVNQADFLAYRSNVRMIAVNPPVVVDVWPVKPDEQWSTT